MAAAIMLYAARSLHYLLGCCLRALIKFYILVLYQVVASTNGVAIRSNIFCDFMRYSNLRQTSDFRFTIDIQDSRLFDARILKQQQQ
jgi:hypothetical protein